jgi:hypothetical protein
MAWAEEDTSWVALFCVFEMAAMAWMALATWPGYPASAWATSG